MNYPSLADDFSRTRGGESLLKISVFMTYYSLTYLDGDLRMLSISESPSDWITLLLKSKGVTTSETNTELGLTLFKYS
jgi:hypothetical protein